MLKTWKLYWLTFLALPTLATAQNSYNLVNKLNEEEVRVAEFIAKAEELWKHAQNRRETIIVKCANESNIAEHNEIQKLDSQTRLSLLKLRREAKTFNAKSIFDPDLSRKLSKISMIGVSALPQDKLERYKQLSNDMAKIYKTVKIPAYNNRKKLLTMKPDIARIMAESRNPDELAYYWTEWRKFTGKSMKHKFIELAELANEAGRLNGFTSAFEMKLSHYESDTFASEVEEMWQGLKPLYLQLHAYVRHRLQKIYGEYEIASDEPIPAHLLGNIWSLNWNNFAEELKPYPNGYDVDVTHAKERQDWTPKALVEKIQEYFQSLGLPPITAQFWETFEKSKDYDNFICQLTSWASNKGENFFNKQYTNITDEEFLRVNHALGLAQYQMAYKNQSFLYRAGANPAFHDGVAASLTLAVNSPSYFKRIDSLDKNRNVTQMDINFLFKVAMNKLVSMPFRYLVSKYWWNLYNGLTNPNTMNCDWVNLMLDIQGIAPPNQRSEEFFDAGASPYMAVGNIKDFLATIYGFDFYKAMCVVAKGYNPEMPLHHCDLYNSREAGTLLYSMMELGASKPWKDVIEVMTGFRGMSTGAFIEYFIPLEKFLKKENGRNGVKVGWRVKNYEKYCRKDQLYM